MSLQDDYYDVEDTLKKRKKPTQGDYKAFDRIWCAFGELEAEVDELRAMKSCLRTAVKIAEGNPKREG